MARNDGAGAWGGWFDWHDCGRPAAQCTPIWSYTVGDLHPLPDGTLWVAVDQMSIGIYPKPGGVARRTPDGRTDTWRNDEGIVGGYTHSIRAVGGRVFAAGREGLLRLTDDQARWDRVLAGFRVTALEELPDDRLAVGMSVGLLVTDPEGRPAGPGHDVLNDALPSPEVTALDAGGNRLCVGTTAGALCIGLDDDRIERPEL